MYHYGLELINRFIISGHLSYLAIFPLSQRWPLNTSLTVYSRIQEKCNHDSCQIFSPPYQGCISFCYHFVSILCFLSICDPHRCLHLAFNISSKEKLLGPWVPNFCSNVVYNVINKDSHFILIQKKNMVNLGNSYFWLAETMVLKSPLELRIFSFKPSVQYRLLGASNSLIVQLIPFRNRVDDCQKLICSLSSHCVEVDGKDNFSSKEPNIQIIRTNLAKNDFEQITFIIILEWYNKRSIDVNVSPNNNEKDKW